MSNVLAGSCVLPSAIAGNDVEVTASVVGFETLLSCSSKSTTFLLFSTTITISWSYCVFLHLTTLLATVTRNITVNNSPLIEIRQRHYRPPNEVRRV